MSASPDRSREAVLYTRPGCPLCFVLRRSARRAARRAALSVREVDVSLDPDLLARYGNETPMLVLPGGRMIRGQASAIMVEAAFREAAASAGAESPRGAIAAAGRLRLRWLARIRDAFSFRAEPRR